MILTAKHYSHIIPLESLINKINSDYNIICLGFKNNKEILNHFHVIDCDPSTITICFQIDLVDADIFLKVGIVPCKRSFVQRCKRLCCAVDTCFEIFKVLHKIPPNLNLCDKVG